LHIPETQAASLDESGADATPLTRKILEKTISDYLNGSQPQDRVVLLFLGNACTIGDKAYLIPFEGEPHSSDTLIAFDWLYERLAACKARQKVLILDVCRLDPRRTTRRIGNETMNAALDKALRSPPEGVEVWSSCAQGQNSLSGDIDGGSLFIEQLFEALEGKAGRQIPLGVERPEDSIPIAKLAAGDGERPGVNRATEMESQKRYKIRQTPRLAGGEKPTFERYNPKLPPAEKLAIDREVREPSLIALYRAITMLDKHEFATPQELRGDIEDCKKFVVAIQKPLAIANLELREVLEQLEEPGNKPSPALVKAFDFSRARVQARIAHHYEYNYMLSHVRTEDLPPLKVGHGAWRLLNQEQINGKGAEGKESKDFAKKARETIEKLTGDDKSIPWTEMANREHLLTIGLAWESAP
jgi:hypothetical protein